MARRRGRGRPRRLQGAHRPRAGRPHRLREVPVSRRLPLAAVVAGAAVALATSCAITPIADARQELLRSWGAWLLDRYDATAAAADTLDARVDALCAAPDEAALTAARDAWTAARAPWKEAEVFAFGPYTEEPIRLGPK
ncbi:MAG: hypothetical protein EP329_23760, partial [Deltaproteobacteria bacterium]